MTVEDRLRATTQAVGASMRPVRPLDLSPASPAAAPARPSRLRATARRVLHLVRRPRGAGRRLPGRRTSGWLVPLAAAAAVVVLAAVLVTVRTLTGTSGGPAAAPSGPAAATAPVTVPKYYAMLAPAGRPGLTVAATATGKPLFTAELSQSGAKKGQTLLFGSVSAAADGRTFAVSVVTFGNATTAGPLPLVGWDVLRGNPDGTSWTLVRSFIPALPPGAKLDSSALSPDGTELAVLSHAQPKHPADATQASLRIYSVASGHVLRTYSATVTVGEIGGSAYSQHEYPSMTWLADGAGLNFGWGPVKDTRTGQPVRVTQQVRHLSLAKPSGNLLASSTLVTAITVPHEICGTLTPTADGKGALCGSEPLANLTACRPVPVSFRLYVGLHGANRVLYALQPARPVTGDCWFGQAAVLWASPSGSTLIGAVSTTQGVANTSAIGVVSGGQFTKLPFTSSAGAF